MARNGHFQMASLTVKSVERYQAKSRVVAGDGSVTITIERGAPLPGSLMINPGDTIDVAIAFNDGT